MKCCKTCPFLPDNANKPTPDGFKEDNPDAPDWFSDEHLIELWEGIRSGEFLACHSTLEDRAKYVGKGVTEKTKPRACIGSLVASYAHFKAYENIVLANPDLDADETYRKYKEEAGEHPFTLDGLRSFAFALKIGRSGTFGGLPIPREFTPPEGVRTAWNDPVVDRFVEAINL